MINVGLNPDPFNSLDIDYQTVGLEPSKLI